MATKTQVNSLMTQYLKLFEQRHKRKPTFNRYKFKWGFESMIDDLGYEDAQTLVEYYTRNADSPDAATLLYTYEQVYKSMIEDRQDRDHIARLMKETRRMVHERGGTGAIKFGNQNEGHSPFTT